MNWTIVAQGVVWNATLALIPVGAGYAFRTIINIRGKPAARFFVSTILGAIWFAFLPNTCYLLTEWRHFLVALDARNLFLKARVDSVYFIELVVFSLFYFLYSSFGMLTFALAIRPVERSAMKGGLAIRVWAFPFFAIVSLGVYLGLVLRFNSWDLLVRPATVWKAIMEITHRPLLAIFIAAFGLFLWVAYEALDIWIDGLKWRLTNRRNATTD